MDKYSLIEIVKPYPLPVFHKETAEMKEFHRVSQILADAGIYGEDNMLKTCDILNLRIPHDGCK